MEYIDGAIRPLNETQQNLPLSGDLVFGSDYFVKLSKEPVGDFDVVNKRYVDALAVDAGSIKNQIRATDSSVLCTTGKVDMSINNTPKLSVDADSIDLT